LKERSEEESEMMDRRLWEEINSSSTPSSSSNNSQLIIPNRDVSYLEASVPFIRILLKDDEKNENKNEILFDSHSSLSLSILNFLDEDIQSTINQVNRDQNELVAPINFSTLKYPIPIKKKNTKEGEEEEETIKIENQTIDLTFIKVQQATRK